VRPRDSRKCPRRGNSSRVDSRLIGRSPAPSPQRQVSSPGELEGERRALSERRRSVSRSPPPTPLWAAERARAAAPRRAGSLAAMATWPRLCFRVADPSRPKLNRPPSETETVSPPGWKPPARDAGRAAKKTGEGDAEGSTFLRLGPSARFLDVSKEDNGRPGRLVASSPRTPRSRQRADHRSRIINDGITRGRFRMCSAELTSLRGRGVESGHNSCYMLAQKLCINLFPFWKIREFMSYWVCYYLRSHPLCNKYQLFSPNINDL